MTLEEQMKKALDLNGVKIYDDENNTAEALNLIGQFGYFSNSKDFDNYCESILAGVDCSYKQIWEPSSEFVVKVKVVQINPFPYLAMLANAQQAMSDDVNQYKYFVLKKDAKFKEEERKLRPYKNISEFLDKFDFDIGDTVTIKRINCENEYEETVLFIGFRIAEKENQKYQYVFLGQSRYTFEELMNNFLYYKVGEWHPFGIKE